jgi:hypothetical protein
MLQKLKSALVFSTTLAVVVLFIFVGTVVAAQPAGTCFLHSSGAPVKTGKCQTLIGNATGQKDTDGNALNYKNCYVVTATSSSEAITLSDCNGNPTPKTTGSAGTVMCSAADGSQVPCGDVDSAATSGNCRDTSKCDLISKYINPFINFLAALVGVVVVISIVIGGIQYGSSAGDSQKVMAAKSRIRNAIIALLAFIFLYAALNFLIPGGLL